MSRAWQIPEGIKPIEQTAVGWKGWRHENLLHLLDENNRAVCNRTVTIECVSLGSVLTVSCPDCKAWLVAKYLQETDD